MAIWGPHTLQASKDYEAEILDIGLYFGPAEDTVGHFPR